LLLSVVIPRFDLSGQQTDKRVEMKTLLVLAAGAALGFGLHLVFEFGLQKWAAVIGLFAGAAFFFYEYATRPGVKRGRK
jgi:hypothetical protein